MFSSQTRSFSRRHSFPSNANEVQGLRPPVALTNPLPHPDWMFSSLDAKPKFEKMCSFILVIHERSSKTPDILFFTLLFQFGWEPFHSISEEIYKLDVLLYANYSCPQFFKVNKIVFKSFVLGVPFVFSLSSPCYILKLPNKGDSIFLSSNDRFDLFFSVLSPGSRDKTYFFSNSNSASFLNPYC